MRTIDDEEILLIFDLVLRVLDLRHCVSILTISLVLALAQLLHTASQYNYIYLVPQLYDSKIIYQ
jgi:hypothetical protein